MLIGELVFTRAIEHLDQARRRLESELKGLGDAQTNDVLEQKEDRELRRERLVALRSQQVANYDGFVKQKQAIQEELRQLHTVSELQRQRDLLTDHEAGLHTQLARNRTVLADIVATSGYKTFLPGAVATFRSVIGDLRTSGELPSAIKTQFVERLLDEHECICGRPLIPGDPHYELVKRWMDRGGMSDVEEAAMRMEGQFSGNDREIGELFERIDGEQEQRSTGKRTLSTVEAELDQIREKLRGSPEDNVRDLQLKLEEVDHSILAVMRDQEADKLQIEVLDREINALEQEMLKRQSKSDQLELTRRRLAACREAKQVLDEVRQRRRTYYRQDLADRINRIFSEMSFTPYSARLGEDYSLTLTDGPNGGPVGASTGESQILSLSFIGAVIEQARDLAARRDNLPGPESSTYPLVMDSPFGNLDSVYRRQVATHMPILASQVVVLVSKTQWAGEVETALEPRIGKEYVLTYHSPKADAEEESIARHGRHYDLVKRSSLEFDATELVEVLR
jgi:DNA sulfur modification protein DndD